MEDHDESNQTLSYAKVQAPPTYVTYGDTVARVVDPMVRVFEKLLKIKEREERGKGTDKGKENEKEATEEPEESAELIHHRSSSRRTTDSKRRSYKSRYQSDGIHQKPKQEEEEIPFSFVKKELEKRTHEEMKAIWFKFVGKHLIDDSIERDWKELIGEIQLDGEESRVSIQKVTSKTKPKDKQLKYRMSARESTNLKDSKPLTRKELIDLHKAQRKVMDMKYVDMFKKEPIKSAYYHNLIKNLQSRNTLGGLASRIRGKAKRKKPPATSEKEHIEIKRKIDIEPDAFVEVEFEHESEGSLDEERLEEDESLLFQELELEAQSLTELKSIETELEWASCHSITKPLGVESRGVEYEADEEEVEMGKMDYIRSVIVGQNTIRDEMELIEEEMVVENIWKNLEEFEAKDSDDSLQFLYLDEKRNKESDHSSQLKEVDTYTEFKRKQKKKAEKEKKEAAFQEKLQIRIEKLAKLKDPSYWQKLMEDSMQKELELGEEESEVYDAEFEDYLESLEQENETLFGEDEEFKDMKWEGKETKDESKQSHKEEVEEEVEEEEDELVLLEEEEQEEQDEVLFSIDEELSAKMKGDDETLATFEEGDIEVSGMEELMDEGDVRKLSDTKTDSTVDEENIEEEETPSKADLQITNVQQISPKARYFNPAYPELFASDASIFPSYTDLKRPYTLVCSDRIKARLSNYKKLFRNELLSLQRRHPFAFGGVQLARQFIIGIRVPHRFVDPLKFREREKVENLLAGRTM
ncbi:glutamic acid-rich protein-like [Cimex lectularius]|uniref:Uncharacterized protein n=1 Tax=Cimex lectularius TaxID=79782 RepID=A0A8I6R916_CIMLE|nr:glutamic acid-rich protein-like [Cimex lectularius]